MTEIEKGEVPKKNENQTHDVPKRTEQKIIKEISVFKSEGNFIKNMKNLGLDFNVKTGELKTPEGDIISRLPMEFTSPEDLENDISYFRIPHRLPELLKKARGLGIFKEIGDNFID